MRFLINFLLIIISVHLYEIYNFLFSLILGISTRHGVRDMWGQGRDGSPRAVSMARQNFRFFWHLTTCTPSLRHSKAPSRSSKFHHHKHKTPQKWLKPSPNITTSSYLSLFDILKFFQNVPFFDICHPQPSPWDIPKHLRGHLNSIITSTKKWKKHIKILKMIHSLPKYHKIIICITFWHF